MNRTILFIICVLLIFSCKQNRTKLEIESKLEFELFSITVDLDNNSTLYLRLENGKDSLMILKQQNNDTISITRFIYFSQREKQDFKDIVLKHLEPNQIFNSNHFTNEGLGAKFTIKSRGRSLTSKYSNIYSFKEISFEFERYLTQHKREIPEIEI